DVWFCPSMTVKNYIDRAALASLPNGRRQARGTYGWRFVDDRDRSMATSGLPELRPLARPDEGQRRTGAPVLPPSRTAYTGDLVAGYNIGVTPSTMAYCHRTGFNAVYFDGHAQWRDNTNEWIL